VRYWDASGLFPLLVNEAATEEARALVKADGIVYVWWGTPVECASGLARRLREGDLDADRHEEALKTLAAAMPGWKPVLPSDGVRADAMRFARLHGLRAGDALQLAAAVSWAQRAPDGLEVVCLDRRLRDAARLEGFTVLPARREVA
jgi:predicted nucleic acid-binding protein